VFLITLTVMVTCLTVFMVTFLTTSLYVTKEGEQPILLCDVLFYSQLMPAEDSNEADIGL